MITKLETTAGKIIERIKSDNGTKCLSTKFQEWLKCKGNLSGAMKGSKIYVKLSSPGNCVDG